MKMFKKFFRHKNDENAQGKMPRGDWCLGDVQFDDCNAITLCAVALGDILINPACGDDYENAPITLHGLTDITEFAQEVMLKIFTDFAELFLEIYNILK